MTTLTRQPIRPISQALIMFGFIMCVQFGCHNAILNKKMGLLMLRECKISKKKDINMNVLYAKNQRLELV